MASVPNFQIPQQNSLAQLGDLVQLRGLLNQQRLYPLQQQQMQGDVQARQLANQQQQMALASQQAMVKAWSDPGFLKEIAPGETGGASGGQGNGAPPANGEASTLGFDPNAMTAALIKRGVLPNQAMGLVGQFVDRSTKVSEAAKNNAAATSDAIGSYQKGLGMLSDKLVPILDMPAAKAGPALAALQQDLAANPIPGLSPQDIQMVQGATLDKLPAVSTLLGFEGKLADWHLRQANTLAGQSKAVTSGVEAQQEASGGTAQQETARYIQIKQDEALGKKPSAQDKAFASAYEQNKTLGQRYLIQSGGNLTGGALDDLATAYHQTGNLPQTGYGAAGTAMRAAIINRSHSMFGEQQLAQSSAAYKANEASLNNLQKMYDQVNAFENTAGKNLNTFLGVAQKVADSGSPWVNVPLRSVNKNGLGSADMAAFEAARQTAVNEIAKVLNSSNASGVLSDAARNEVNGLIGPNATFRQIVSASRILQQDMANRHDSYQEQIQDIRSRLAPANGNGAASNVAAASAARGVLTQAAIAKAAQDHGITVQQAEAAAKAAGYSVQ